MHIVEKNRWSQSYKPEMYWLCYKELPPVANLLFSGNWPDNSRHYGLWLPAWPIYRDILYGLQTFKRVLLFRAVYCRNAMSDAWSERRVTFALLLPTPGHRLFACCCPGSCFKKLMINVVVWMFSGHTVPVHVTWRRGLTLVKLCWATSEVYFKIKYICFWILKPCTFMFCE